MSKTIQSINKLFTNPLLYIFLFALILRLVGINHSLPFVFHPDEPSVIRSALGIRFDKNPGHFDWPHLYFYINYILYMLIAKFREILSILNLKESFEYFWNEPSIFYLSTRVVSAFIGAFTIFPIFFTGRYLFSKRVGLLAAFIFATMPFHVRHSHYALIDVPMVFFLSFAMYYSAKLLVQKNYSTYILAGTFVGLAASTKYNGGLSAIAVVIAHLFRTLSAKVTSVYDRYRLRSFLSIHMFPLFLAGIFSIFAFILFTPYAVLDNKDFIRTDNATGALWQFTNVGSVSLRSYPSHLSHTLFSKLPADIGLTYWYIYFLAAFFSLYGVLIARVMNGVEIKEQSKVLFLVVPSIVFILYISKFDTARSHYFMIAYPYVAILSAYMVSLLFDALQKKSKLYAYCLAILLFSIPVYSACRQSLIFYNGDTRAAIYKEFFPRLTLNNTLIYTDGSLNEIAYALSKNPYKGVDYVQTFEKGYLLVLYNVSAQELIQTLPWADDYVFNLESEKPATLMLGPNVAMFSFIKK